MRKSYYLFNPGRLARKDNTLRFTAYDEDGNELPSKYIPVDGVEQLFAFGSLDANSAMFNFLSQHGIAVHFFDYYEHYTGSFMPKEYLLSGKMQIAQTSAYIHQKRRLEIARCFVVGASHNMLKNLRYYGNRERDLNDSIQCIEELMGSIENAMDIQTLMGVEGNIRKNYYACFDSIIRTLQMGARSKMPPTNEVNALISFGNSMCYTLCLDAIHHTQLNPTISFLHEPGERRYSLALDIAEVFKPILVDRLIFSLLNKRVLAENDFERKLNGCVLRPGGRKTFVRGWDEKLTETIKHRKLGRSVSYKHLVKLECYKLSKHLLGMEVYKPFKAWW